LSWLVFYAISGLYVYVIYEICHFYQEDTS
jgi:hypothetical protein